MLLCPLKNNTGALKNIFIVYQHRWYEIQRYRFEYIGYRTLKRSNTSRNICLNIFEYIYTFTYNYRRYICTCIYAYSTNCLSTRYSTILSQLIHPILWAMNSVNATCGDKTLWVFLYLTLAVILIYVSIFHKSDIRSFHI